MLMKQECENMKKEYNFGYLSLAVGIFGVLILFVFLLSQKTNIEWDCNIQNIELKNVSPNKCDFLTEIFHDEDLAFSNEYCPIPEDIQCSFKLESNILNLNNLLRILK